MAPARIRRIAAAAALAPVLFGASAGGAAPAAPAVGAAFALASGFQPDYAAGPSALGPDGTAWLAQPGFGAEPSSSFEILARAADGRVLRPVLTSDGGGSATDRPAIAAGPGGATFVWETASDFGGSAGTTQVRARSCTLAGCGPVQVLARWRWTTSGTVGSSGFTAVGDAEPGVASAAGRVVAVFDRQGGATPGMEWATAAGGRFGPVHALPGPGGPDAALAADGAGGVVGAWTVGELASFGHGVEWTSWSARDGFSRPRALAGTRGVDAGLVAAGAGSGVALAWLQGANISDPVPAEPLWVARRGGSGRFSKPFRVFARDAVGLTLAGASGTLALAFSATTGPGASSDGPGPAWVSRSVAGRPFGPAVDLDRSAAPYPTVTVAASGDVLAAWNACPSSATGTCSAELARARGGSRFAAPRALGSEDPGDAPQIHASGDRALITWRSSGAVRGVIVTS